ncbi:discoidin domain-containing protein [Paenibacillus sp. CF384]|uniref:discoidin domain-containing protein n=1 Tax=Paenibacillus sp. CF384 TaxID=1884382 RepID=UPI00089B146A|nr:discoidin domain-containing protein [Paenibacillus sp. CF384]SDX58019.1 Calcium-activated chloride channel [Paenibacillus sp. CF384]
MYGIRRLVPATLIMCLALLTVFSPLGPANTAYAVDPKLTLTASMVVNESGLGTAGMLVDEQSAAGNPLGGAGGSTNTYWHPGWTASTYPASAYIDLGQSYTLSAIYLFDHEGAGNYTVSSGSPGNWTPLFTDPLTGYLAWNAHAVNVSTRYVRVTMLTDQSKMSEIVIYGSSGSGGADTTAPAAVANLAAGSPTTTLATLSWTSPGDDGSTGTASSYDIRYSTSTITTANWGSATQVSGEPMPAASGTSQSMSITGLTASTTYYFAIRTNDEVPNLSALSNIASITTSSSGGGGTGTKITLSPAMLTNESGLGSAELLVDEQTLAGNPLGGAGGNPATYWHPGWNPSSYPASVTIDLGQSYQLSHIYLYDHQGSGSYGVFSGTPGIWTSLFTDGLTNYLVWNPHAVNVNTRYLRLTMGSLDAKMAEIVLYGTASGGGGPDTTPPGAVTNLAKGTVSSTSVTLQWTAPGDDGAAGYASSYDVRFSTAPITASNWSNATQANNEPIPGTPGSAQSFSVTGLQPQVLYYFAMKTTDDVGLISALSNVVNATTSAPSANCGPYAPRVQHTVDKFLGVNGFNDVPVDIQSVGGALREYHPWPWDETNSAPYPNNLLKFNPSYSGDPWNFDNVYATHKAAGIDVSPVIWQTPNFIAWGHEDKPVYPAGASTTSPNSYVAKAEHMYQFVARYGSQTVPDANLKLAPDQPRLSGLNSVRYFENWNEPDKNWMGAAAQFSPAELAAMSSADFDANCRSMANADKLGVKNADPTARMVMGGLFQIDVPFLDGMKAWASANREDGKLPLDVINVHHYSSSAACCSGNGISPEADNLKGRLQALTAWRDTNEPDKEVWFSEFGWGTKAGNWMYAPPIGPYSSLEVQGMWTIRAYMAGLAAGVDRMHYYAIRDSNPFSSQWDLTTGLTYFCSAWSGCDINQYTAAGYTQYQKKPAWYYINTLKNRLTGMRFNGEQASGNSNVLIYKIKHPTTGAGAYVVWAPTSNNTVVSNYQLTVSGATSATLVQLNESSTGNASSLTISAGKVTVNVAEKPVLIMVNSMP